MSRVAYLILAGMLLAAVVGGCGKKGPLEVPGRSTADEPRDRDDGTVFTY